MGHAIHKHMNSFKAKNLLSVMPIDNRASALEMESPAKVTKEAQEKILASGANDAFKAAIAKKTPVAMNQAPTMKKGAMYMKDDMAPKMEEGSPAYKYDKVILGGNKGDVSKTKPGKKDFK